MDLRGAAGAALVSAYTGAAVVPLGDRSFRARVRIVPLVDIRIRSVRATPHRASRPSCSSPPRDTLIVDLLISGRRTGHYQGAPFVDVAGSVALRRGRAPTVWRCAEPTAALEIEVPLASLPTAVGRAVGSLPGQCFEAPAVTAVVIALLRSALACPPAPATAAAAAVEDALLGLVAALVLRNANPPRARNDVFATVLAAVTLAPAARYHESELAAVIGVAPAELREAIGEQGTTLARLVRAVRMSALTELLTYSDPSVPLFELAARAGYGDADQARRALRSRFGVGMREYRSLFRAR